jgi:hypothetical protein
VLAPGTIREPAVVLFNSSDIADPLQERGDEHSYRIIYSASNATRR